MDGTRCECSFLFSPSSLVIFSLLLFSYVMRSIYFFSRWFSIISRQERGNEREFLPQISLIFGTQKPLLLVGVWCVYEGNSMRQHQDEKHETRRRRKKMMLMMVLLLFPFSYIIIFWEDSSPLFVIRFSFLASRETKSWLVVISYPMFMRRRCRKMFSSFFFRWPFVSSFRRWIFPYLSGCLYILSVFLFHDHMI